MFRQAVQRMQLQGLAADAVGQHLGAAVVEQDEVELLAGRRRGTPVQNEVYGFIRSAVLDRGRSCRKTSKSCQVGMTFSRPMTETRHLRQGQAHPAVALRLDDADGAGLGDAEVRAR